MDANRKELRWYSFKDCRTEDMDILSRHNPTEVAALNKVVALNRVAFNRPSTAMKFVFVWIEKLVLMAVRTGIVFIIHLHSAKLIRLKKLGQLTRWCLPSRLFNFPN